jgi:transglutaminase-like putative cysteine protease
MHLVVRFGRILAGRCVLLGTPTRSSGGGTRVIRHSGGVSNSLRRISAELTFDVAETATIAFQLRASSSAGRVREERLVASLDGRPITDPQVIETEYTGTLHEFTPGPGEFRLTYHADLEAPAQPVAPMMEFGSPALERHRMLRPSRYCPSDHVGGLAKSEFGDIDGDAEKVAAITTWINDRVVYVPGSSDIHDSAENTLLTGQGICRDFAHLGILLCRALDVPARFAAVYAPGLFPMDFHAVFEAWHDGAWWVYDATRLAPRQSLVRIATGRDAADASFATVSSGIASLQVMEVTATTDGDLPIDGYSAAIALS